MKASMPTLPHTLLLPLGGLVALMGCSAETAPAPTQADALGNLALDCGSDHPFHREFARPAYPGAGSHGGESTDTRTPAIVGLTFVGGPWAHYQQDDPDLATIVDVLDERNVAATFFFEEKKVRSVNDGSPYMSPGFAAAFDRLGARTVASYGSDLPNHLVAAYGSYASPGTPGGFPMLEEGGADLDQIGVDLERADDELARAGLLGRDSLSFFGSTFPAGVPCDATYAAQTLLDRSMIGWHVSATAGLRKNADNRWPGAADWAKAVVDGEALYSAGWWLSRGLGGVVVQIDAGALYRRAAYADAEGNYVYDGNAHSNQAVVREYLEALLDAFAADPTYAFSFTTLAGTEFLDYHARTMVRLDGSDRAATFAAELGDGPEAGALMDAASCASLGCDAVGAARFDVQAAEVADGDRVFVRAILQHERPEDLRVTVYRNADFANYYDNFVHGGAFGVDLDGNLEGGAHDQLRYRIEKSADGDLATIYVEGFLDRNASPANYTLEVLDLVYGATGKVTSFEVTVARRPLVGGAEPAPEPEEPTDDNTP